MVYLLTREFPPFTVGLDSQKPKINSLNTDSDRCRIDKGRGGKVIVYERSGRKRTDSPTVVEHNSPPVFVEEPSFNSSRYTVTFVSSLSVPFLVFLPLLVSVHFLDFNPLSSSHFPSLTFLKIPQVSFSTFSGYLYSVLLTFFDVFVSLFYSVCFSSR